jgi:hypothetical protein
MAMTIQSRASRQVSGSEMPKSSLGLWYVILPRGSRRVSGAILFGRGIRNSECNSIKQNRTLSDLKQKSLRDLVVAVRLLAVGYSS